MNSFCTLFDSNYLSRGLALYRSLALQNAKFNDQEFQLIVYCFDDAAYETLQQLRLRNVRPVALREFETPELLKVKPTRSTGEYCWTSTPIIIEDALNRFTLKEVTYLDADLFFFGPPSLLLEEFWASGSSILLTEHGYSPQYDHASVSGKYCVQFMTFRSDDRGRKALRWWAERCLEWCFNRVEDGKFGDQRYLDDWTERFEGVHVLKHIGGGVAPWNVQRFDLKSGSNGPTVNDVPVVFYHFHQLQWIEEVRFRPADGYEIEKQAVELLYVPYFDELRRAVHSIRKVIPGFRAGIFKPKASILRRAKRLRDRISGKVDTVHIPS